MGSKTKEWNDENTCISIGTATSGDIAKIGLNIRHVYRGGTHGIRDRSPRRSRSNYVGIEGTAERADKMRAINAAAGCKTGSGSGEQR